MDWKTKALLQQGQLHTEGAVKASFDVHHLTHKVDVFPPHMSFAVSDQVLHDVKSPTGMLDLAHYISKSVAAIVEKQVLAVLETDAKSAMKAVYEEKKAALNDPNMLWFPKEPQKKGTIWDKIFVNLAPPEDAPVTWDSLKEYANKINGGVFHSSQPGHPVFFQGGPHGHMSHVGFDPASGAPQAAQNEITKVFHDLIPGFAKMKQPCPTPNETCAPYEPPGFLQDTIIHLNDIHKWSRERIADWLETLDHDLTLKTPEEVQAEKDKTTAHHEMLKEMIGQPLLDHQADIVKSLMGNDDTQEEVKNGDNAG
jgi:hypothetical protein